ncbi:MAG: polysaccharide deacetylase family protein [Clostridia bacterium]|nr:polysaccharide deacetylase family protein [Clostridia bacterium]
MIKNCFANGAKKAVTFSFDDGITQDVRLIALMDKYGLKGTFNLNSGLMGQKDSLDIYGTVVDHSMIPKGEIRQLYKNHEIAGHTLTHPLLTDLTDDEVIYEIEQDRLKLSEIAGYEVVGFAFPNPWGKIEDFTHLSELCKKTGVKYARTTYITDGFEYEDDLFSIGMTVSISNIEHTFELAKKFVDLKTETPKVFYIMGHAYEFDYFKSWDKAEELFKFISNRDDIFYGTNKEIYLLN